MLLYSIWIHFPNFLHLQGNVKWEFRMRNSRPHQKPKLVKWIAIRTHSCSHMFEDMADWQYIVYVAWLCNKKWFTWMTKPFEEPQYPLTWMQPQSVNLKYDCCCTLQYAVYAHGAERKGAEESQEEMVSWLSWLFELVYLKRASSASALTWCCSRLWHASIPLDWRTCTHSHSHTKTHAHAETQKHASCT